MRRVLCGSVLCMTVFAASALAADKADAEIRDTILKAIANWAVLNLDANDPVYTSDPQALFYDISPLKYDGWQAYKDGAKKILAAFKDFKLGYNQDLAAHHAGNLGWATGTWKLDGHDGTGKEVHLEGRATTVLERRHGKWVILHEHYSVPIQM